LVGRLSSDRHVLTAVAEGIRRSLGYVPKGKQSSGKDSSGARGRRSDERAGRVIF
jgi:hypothetical protein